MNALETISDDHTDGIDVAGPRPRTLTVLGLLVTAALVLSYFVAFPLTNVLRSADVIAAPSSLGPDPRLRLMAVTFASLLGAALLLGMLFRVMSRRQLRRIDEMSCGNE
jgi:hypothetical protein